MQFFVSRTKMSEIYITDTILHDDAKLWALSEFLKHKVQLKMENEYILVNFAFCNFEVFLLLTSFDRYGISGCTNNLNQNSKI